MSNPRTCSKEEREAMLELRHTLVEALNQYNTQLDDLEAAIREARETKQRLFKQLVDLDVEYGFTSES